MATLVDVPDDVMVDLVSQLPPRDVLSLGRVNKWLQSVCDDDIVWKRKLTDLYPMLSGLRVRGHAATRSVRRLCFLP